MGKQRRRSCRADHRSQSQRQAEIVSPIISFSARRDGTGNPLTQRSSGLGGYERRFQKVAVTLQGQECNRRRTSLSRFVSRPLRAMYGREARQEVVFRGASTAGRAVCGSDTSFVGFVPRHVLLQKSNAPGKTGGERLPIKIKTVLETAGRQAGRPAAGRSVENTGPTFSPVTPARHPMRPAKRPSDKLHQMKK